MTGRKLNISRRIAIGMGAAVLSFSMLVMSPMVAQANYNKEEAGEVEYEPDTKDSTDDSKVTSVVTEDTTGKPFSVEGNGELLDDATEDESKEFLTVTTKNNQTFFVVIDKANTTNNVYMLSMIDENDLQEFLSDEDVKEAETGLSLPEKEEKTFEEIQAEEEAKKAKEAEEKKAQTKKNTWVFVLVMAVAAGLICGGYYYFKFYKPRKEEETAENEHLEDGHRDNEYDEDEDEPVVEDDVTEDDADDSVDVSNGTSNNSTDIEENPRLKTDEDYVIDESEDDAESDDLQTSEVSSNTDNTNRYKGFDLEEEF